MDEFGKTLRDLRDFAVNASALRINPVEPTPPPPLFTVLFLSNKFHFARKLPGERERKNGRPVVSRIIFSRADFAEYCSAR